MNETAGPTEGEPSTLYSKLIEYLKPPKKYFLLNILIFLPSNKQPFKNTFGMMLISG